MARADDEIGGDMGRHRSVKGNWERSLIGVDQHAGNADPFCNRFASARRHCVVAVPLWLETRGLSILRR